MDKEKGSFKSWQYSPPKIGERFVDRLFNEEVYVFLSPFLLYLHDFIFKLHKINNGMNQSTHMNRNSQTTETSRDFIPGSTNPIASASNNSNDLRNEHSEKEDKLNLKGNIKIKTPQIYTITSQSLILILLLSFSIGSLKSKLYNLIFIFVVGYFYFNAMNYDLLMFKIFLSKEKGTEIRERINEKMVQYGFLKKLNLPTQSTKKNNTNEEAKDLSSDLNSLNEFIEHFWEKIYIHLSAYIYKEININLNPLKNYVQLKKFLLSTPPKFKTISLKIIENNLEINLKTFMAENENLIEVLLGFFKVKIPLRISDLRFQVGIKIIIKLNDILDILNIENKKYEPFYINLEKEKAPKIGILGSDLSDHLKIIFKNQEFVYKKLINLHVFLHEIPEIKFNLTPLNSFDVMSYMQLQRVVNSVIERVCKDLVKNGLILNLRDVNDENYAKKNFYSLELKHLCFKNTSLKIEGIEVICLEKDSPVKIFTDLNISKYGKLCLTDTLTPFLDTYLSKYSLNCPLPLKFNFLGKPDSFLILFYTNKGIMTSQITSSLFNLNSLNLNIYKCKTTHSSHLLPFTEADTFFSKYLTQNPFHNNCCKVKGICTLSFKEGFFKERLLGNKTDTSNGQYFYLKLLVDSPQIIEAVLFHKPFLSKRVYLKEGKLKEGKSELKETYLKGSLEVGNGNTAMFKIPCKDNSIEIVASKDDYLSFFTNGSQFIDLEVLEMCSKGNSGIPEIPLKKSPEIPSKKSPEIPSKESLLATRNYFQIWELQNDDKETKILNGISVKILEIRPINFPSFLDSKNTPPKTHQNFLKLFLASHTLKRNIDEYSLIFEIHKRKKLIRCDFEPVIYIPIDEPGDFLNFTAHLLRNNKRLSTTSVKWNLTGEAEPGELRIDSLNFRGEPVKVNSSSSSRLSEPFVGISAERESLEDVINIPIAVSPSNSSLVFGESNSSLVLREGTSGVDLWSPGDAANDSVFGMNESRIPEMSNGNSTLGGQTNQRLVSSSDEIFLKGLSDGETKETKKAAVSTSDDIFGALAEPENSEIPETKDSEIPEPETEFGNSKTKGLEIPETKDLETPREEALTESKVGVLLEEVIKIPKTVEMSSETRKNHVVFENEFIFSFDFAVQKFHAEMSPSAEKSETKKSETKKSETETSAEANTFYVKICPVPLGIENYFFEIHETLKKSRPVTRESLNSADPIEFFVNRCPEPGNNETGNDETEKNETEKNNLKIKIFRKTKNGPGIEIFEGFLNFYSENSILLNSSVKLPRDAFLTFKKFLYDDFLILPFKKEVYKTDSLTTPSFLGIEFYVESLLNLKTIEESLKGTLLEELFGLNSPLKESLFLKIFFNKKCIFKSKALSSRNVFINQIWELQIQNFNRLEFVVYQKKKPVISNFKNGSDGLLLWRHSNSETGLEAVIKRVGASFGVKKYLVASGRVEFEEGQLYRDFRIKRELTGAMGQSTGIILVFDIKRVF